MPKFITPGRNVPDFGMFMVAADFDSLIMETLI